ncbi:MAG: hypothetical protein QG641_2453, partial [Candidatus Poribacteria bacterium]|nr:hypothetical protein [Candidatus Poribacteria bacterium]
TIAEIASEYGVYANQITNNRYKACCISFDGAFVFSDRLDVPSTQDTSQR